MKKENNNLLKNALKNADDAVNLAKISWEDMKPKTSIRKKTKKGIVIYYKNTDTKCSELLTEYEQIKKIPKTNLTYRFDKGKTNPPVADHIHVFHDGQQLYAINIDGTAHDGSKAKLNRKEIQLLRDIGFNPPPNGILEYFELNINLNYKYKIFKFELLLG